eukprot:CAMPEP_0175163708 /NCGR_PEP_ID=MMETSP0087-20121206/25934_1 /TAXON_ID=136419 /ORGANISM="Unknown Unknown, Strain D1" /LENGTH=270 /DNA_ID=CAMNT_0016452511 /DNA_START=34 /DNA_END=846 /DNA_ORIENTATION=-
MSFFAYNTYNRSPMLSPSFASSVSNRLFSRLERRNFLSGASSLPALVPPPAKEDEGKLCVVLDMDETLVHAVFSSGKDYRQAEDRQTHNESASSSFTITLPSDASGPAEDVQIFTRPGLQNLLHHLHSNNFEPILFTAALPVYANPVLDYIDQNRVFRARLFRDSTVHCQGYPYVKDIRMLGRDMKRVVIVDNNPSAMLATVDNAIPIKDFYGDKNDSEFDHLIKLLDHLEKLEDVRPFLKQLLQFGRKTGLESDLRVDVAYNDTPASKL